MTKKRFKRVILKISGEALAGEQGYGIDPSFGKYLARQVKILTSHEIETGLVVGGGNIFRGLAGVSQGLTRVSADYMGMLATIINGLALQDVFIEEGIPTRIFTPFEMPAFAIRFNASQADYNLREGRLCVFAGGTGNPYFSTDSAAALKAAEVRAEILLKATKVDGVYDKDPVKHPDARKYDRLSYQQMLEKDLRVMDSTAIALCREVNIPIFVFNLRTEGNFEKIAAGDLGFGTLVTR
jgi:uridylate kinase